MNSINEDNYLFKEREQINKDSINDIEYNSAAKKFFEKSINHKYSYQFDWLGRPIIQYPQDIIAIQEIVYQTKPDLIIETGIAHGGSTILLGSLISLLDILEGLNPRESKRKVISIDVEIRAHNKQALINHPLSYKYDLIEGSSVSEKVINEVYQKAKDYNKVMVVLDSNHTHQHVLEELEAYARLVSCNNYCLVFDTIIEDLPKNTYPQRPWDVGNNPKTAVNTWLKNNSNFIVDQDITDNLLLSVAPSGYLKRIK